MIDASGGLCISLGLIVAYPEFSISSLVVWFAVSLFITVDARLFKPFAVFVIVGCLLMIDT